MALLNYTTSVDASRTVAQIQDILRGHGAKSVLIEYDSEGLIESLSFCAITPRGEFAIRLPIDPEAVLKVLARNNVSRKYQEKAQAVRIAWRIVKDWTEAQMALLETEMVDLEQIFLPYIGTKDGKTVYDKFLDNRLALGAGGRHEPS
jgi:hypothetical protein